MPDQQELTARQERQLRRTLARLGDQRGAIAGHLRLPAPVTLTEQQRVGELLDELRGLYAGRNGRA